MTCTKMQVNCIVHLNGTTGSHVGKLMSTAFVAYFFSREGWISGPVIPGGWSRLEAITHLCILTFTRLHKRLPPLLQRFKYASNVRLSQTLDVLT